MNRLSQKWGAIGLVALVFLPPVVTGCGGGGGVLGAPVGGVSPTVVETEPVDQATKMPIQSVLSATFGQAIAPETITKTTFLVFPSIQGEENSLEGDISYDVATRTATFTPSVALEFQTTYQAILTTGVKNISGLPLEKNFVWSFTTEEKVEELPQPPPEIPPPTPSDLTAPTVPENLSAVPVDDYTIRLSWAASSDHVGVTGYTVFRNGVEVGLVQDLVLRDEGLSPGTAYTYEIDAFDAAGNHSAHSSSVSVQTPRTIFYVSTTGDDSISNNGSQEKPWRTIQHAVDNVLNGNTIRVQPGTYIENIIISKPLTLVGESQNATIIQPALSNPDCLAGGGGGSLCSGGSQEASNIILVQSNDVVIRDMTLDGDNPAWPQTIDARNGIITDHRVGTFNGLEVSHVTVRNMYLRGIYASSGGTFYFHDNLVQNVQSDPASVAMFNFDGSGIFSANTVSDAADAISSNHSSGVQFLNNVITNSGSGIHTDNAGDAGGVADLIQGNQVSNCTVGGFGIWALAPTLSPKITGNTVIHCNIGLALLGQRVPIVMVFDENVVDGENDLTSTGVYLTTDQLGTGSGDIITTLTHNKIVRNGKGLVIDALPGASTTVQVNRNDISANNQGLVNNTADPLQAHDNYWGSSTGPTNPNNVGGTGDSVLGNVDFSPWSLISFF